MVASFATVSGRDQLLLAETAFAAKNYAKAIEHAEEALRLGLDIGAPDSERGEYAPKEESSRCEILWGMALLESGGDRDAALEHCNRAVSFAREDKRAWSNRGHLRRERGELELALADLGWALKYDPDYVFARLRRAQCLQTLGRLEEAEQDLAQILLKTPCDAFPFALWQEIRAQRGLPNDATQLPQPKDVAAFVARGIGFAQSNEHLRAIADFDAAIALSPTPYAFLNRGLAHRALGNLAEAKADLEVWVKVDPGWAPAVAAIDAALKAQSDP